MNKFIQKFNVLEKKYGFEKAIELISLLDIIRMDMARCAVMNYEYMGDITACCF